MNLRIDSIHFNADEKLTDYIHEKIGKIEIYFDRIIDVAVRLKLENNSQVKDKVVEIKMVVPGETLLVKETQKSFEAATDIASDTLKRQLKKYKSRLRNHH